MHKRQFVSKSEAGYKVVFSDGVGSDSKHHKMSEDTKAWVCISRCSKRQEDWIRKALRYWFV